MFTFNKKYFILTILLFLLEVFIAMYIHDRWIRPYGGDFLVVILLYCFVKSFLNLSNVKTAFGVLIFSYAIETLQYLNLVKKIGLQDSRLANIIIGNSFEWVDILAYTLGIGLVLIIEKFRK